MTLYRNIYSFFSDFIFYKIIKQKKMKCCINFGMLNVCVYFCKIIKEHKAKNFFFASFQSFHITYG